MNEAPKQTTNIYLTTFAIVYLLALGLGVILNVQGTVPYWYELFTGGLVAVATTAYVFVAFSMVALYLSKQMDLIREQLPVSVIGVAVAMFNVALMLANQFVTSAYMVAGCILTAYFVRIVLAPTVNKNSG